MDGRRMDGRMQRQTRSLHKSFCRRQGNLWQCLFWSQPNLQVCLGSRRQHYGHRAEALFCVLLVCQDSGLEAQSCRVLLHCTLPHTIESQHSLKLAGRDRPGEAQGQQRLRLFIAFRLVPLLKDSSCLWHCVELLRWATTRLVCGYLDEHLATGRSQDRVHLDRRCARSPGCPSHWVKLHPISKEGVEQRTQTLHQKQDVVVHEWQVALRKVPCPGCGHCSFDVCKAAGSTRVVRTMNSVEAKLLPSGNP
mmetsp:Transcript_16082/g.25710  ORF Transcript_16082/g.25710 Transcript_16082/m.25710 type:complete len:250 (+) Transcript_16082:722-1471(+)